MTLYNENIIMEKPTIELEYCVKCGWLSRAAWISQEILNTFSNEVSGVILIPSQIGGIFEIRCNNNLLWEKNNERTIPDIKTLKQNIRDLIAPNKTLGHIDKF